VADSQDLDAELFVVAFADGRVEVVAAFDVAAVAV
jgi:hypothetical protein